MSYEQMVARVEEITARIESGEGGLEESIKLYEEGVRLSKRCQELLLKAQQRVEELNKDLLGGAGGAGEGRLAADSDLSDEDEQG